MKHARSWTRAFRFWRSDIAADVDNEMRFHLDARTADLVAAGSSVESARAQALAEFGDVDTVRADLQGIDRRIASKRQRAERGGALLTDVRLAARSLRRTPAFTCAAVLTIALGVGVNSVIVSAVRGVLLQPLAYDRPEELVDLREVTSNETANARTAGSFNSVSPANLVDYRRENTVFSGMAAYALLPMNLTGGNVPRRITTNQITSDFFDVLGVRPAIGRSMRPGEDAFGAPRVALISHGLWQDLGADSTILERKIRLDGELYDVIGVLPRGFKAPNQDRVTDPIAAYVATAFPPALLSVEGHGDHIVDVVARVKPGVPLERVQLDLARISSSLAERYPETNMGVHATVQPLRDAIVSNVRTALLVLLGAVGLVWLVSCVNLANLMLVRTASRQRELTMRVALGASRSRILQALVAHGLVIAALGCAAGVVLGLGLQRLLLRYAPPDIPRLDAIAFDVPVFAVAALLSVLAGVVFGTLPAWHASRADPAQSLRASERGSRDAAVLRRQRVLVVAEIALSCVLLVGSGLLLRSFATLMGVELGFRTDRVLAVGVTLPAATYPDGEARLRFFEALEQRLAQVPGVRAVAFANRLPMRGGWRSGLQIDAPAADSAADVTTDVQAVSPGYFDTFGIALVRGRLLTERDRRGGMPVAVVNEAFVRRFFANGDALEHRFRRGSSGPWITIVGVVRDIRRAGKTGPLAPGAYLPAAQTDLYPVIIADVAVAADSDPMALVPAVRAAVLSIDPNQPIANVRTMDEIVSRSVSMRRFEALLLTLFAATAFVLAVVGIYGVVSYSVAQRTREFGVRVALGARPAQVVRGVLAQGSALIGLGLLLGMISAFWLARYLETMLFEVTPADLPTYVGVALSLGIVALVACALPARRASNVDPVTALRYE